MLAGCGGSSGGGDSSSDTGTASFSATDAPVDSLARVDVTFGSIALKPADGPMETYEFDQPVTIDLLSLTGEESATILGDTEVPAGEYSFVRLFVLGGTANGSEVEEDGGGVFDLYIPGQQNRPEQSQGQPRFLQLNAADDQLVVPAGGNVDFTIDFDLRKALTKPENQEAYYLLRPALRLVNNVEVDTIQGEVSPELTLAENCTTPAETGNAVYLYEGFDQTPGDVNVTASTGNEQDDPQPDHDTDDSDGDTTEVNPVTTATVSQQDEDTMLEYTIGFVAEGDYTIAFTCEADRDMSETDEDMIFEQPTNVTVDADDDPEVVNFETVAEEPAT
ncbi:putative lipoprotein [Salinisphaera sp. PC39]